MSHINFINKAFAKISSFVSRLLNFRFFACDQKLIKAQSDLKCVLNDLYALNDKYQEVLLTLDVFNQRDSLFLGLNLIRSNELIRSISLSKSQLHQDLFVLYLTNFKRGGYFVEFGACDGKLLSNTYLLEKEYGWNGVLSEPACIWRDSLITNRSCSLDFNCIWSKSGETLQFNEVEDAGLSTIGQFSSSDSHATARSQGKSYPVTSLSLLDLLINNSAPAYIDYISIDTEGSELVILESFDFTKFSFGIITCEHNYTDKREAIHSLLTSKGYLRVLTEVSRFDDWYINPKIHNIDS